MHPSFDQIRQILQAGIAAPSAENKHYLGFELRDTNTTLLHATDAASWDSLPHRRFLALLSYGAVAENMALRAAELGFAQSVRWQLGGSGNRAIGEFKWTPSLLASDPLAQAVALRHTNRRFFRRTALAPATLQRMRDAVQHVPEAQLVWLEGAARGTALEAIRVAETERFRRPALHEELFGAVRFELGWRRGADEWLPPAALEVEPPMRPGFAMLRRWPLMKALTTLGVHHLLGLRAAAMPSRLAPHLGLIVAAGVDPADRALQAGRALQRAWLAATADGVAFQPMAAATVLVEQRPGDGWVSGATQERLKALLGSLSPTPSAVPSMFFRVGHAAAPSLVTGRRPLEHYLLDRR